MNKCALKEDTLWYMQRKLFGILSWLDSEMPQKQQLYVWTSALYVLLELLPITIVFIIIIFFDVPITSGAANRFVLFFQVVETLQV